MAVDQLSTGALPEFWIVPEAPLVDFDPLRKARRKPACLQVPTEEASTGMFCDSATLSKEDDTKTPLKICQLCHKAKPLADFQSYRGEVKTCGVCRARKRAYSRKHHAKVKAKVEAFKKLQNSVHNTSVPRGISQFAFPDPPVVMTESIPNQKVMLRLDTREVLSPDVESPTLETSHDSPSPSPEFEDEGPETTSDTASSAWFRCLHCGIARRAGARYSVICLYCLEHEQKFCVFGDHERDRPRFVGGDGVEYDECNDCREGRQRGEETDISPSD